MNHPYQKGILNCKKGRNPFQREDNHETVEIGLLPLKTFHSRINASKVQMFKRKLLYI